MTLLDMQSDVRHARTVMRKHGHKPVQKGRIFMRLVEKNIECVKQLRCDGTPYEWVVLCKSGRVSDMRTYVNRDVTGRSIVADYPVHCLPAAVQAFVYKHKVSETLELPAGKHGEVFEQVTFE